MTRKQSQRNPQWLEGRAAADTGATECPNPYDPETDYWKAAQFACGFGHGRQVLAIRALLNGGSAQ